MEVIEVLDKYVEGDAAGGNALMSDELVDRFCSEPDRNVHKLLLAFSVRGLTFERWEAPTDMGYAMEMMAAAGNVSEKYFYAIHMLRLSNPIASGFVDAVLERIGAV